MKRFLQVALFFSGTVWWFGLSCARAQDSSWPSLQEVLGLVRSNLTSVSEAELNQAAVAGLLSQLKNRVILVTNGTAAATSPGNSPRLAKTALFEGQYAYIRIAEVAAGLGEEFDAAYERVHSTNRLRGLVIDLRFANGQDYTSVEEIADRFLETEQVLFKIGETAIRAAGKTKPITLPLAILVNHETAGAAEVLAAVLRQADAGLVIGSATAGQAHPFRDFRLSNGQLLKIASGTIEMANGKELTGQGLSPDIPVVVSTSEEKAYLEDPYRSMGKTSSLVSDRGGLGRGAGFVFNDRRRRRMNEAELVRMQHEGLDVDQESAAPMAEQSLKVTMQDPVLGRALDFVKGLAVVQNRR